MFATAIVVILSGVVVTSVIIVDGLHFIVMMPVMLATGIDGTQRFIAATGVRTAAIATATAIVSIPVLSDLHC